MKRSTVFAALASLALAACAPGSLGSAAIPIPPAAPVVIADRVVLDEQVGTGVELAYKLVRLSLELAVDTGQLKGARAAQAQVLNRKAYGFTLATQSAYRAANAASYRKSADEALATIAELGVLLGSK